LTQFNNEKYDVIKFSAEGSELRRLRTIIDKYPNEDGTVPVIRRALKSKLSGLPLRQVTPVQNAPLHKSLA
jgi:hypothetical protein